VAAVSDYALDLPLQTILGQLPPELQNRVATAAPDVSVSVPVQTILPQLTHGVVRVSFGELRNLAPGIFSSASDHDHVLVQLPLAEILPRISPNLLRRRPAQKRIDVPADIEGPFNEKGVGLIISPSSAQVASAVPKPPRSEPPLILSLHMRRGSSIAAVPPKAPLNVPPSLVSTQRAVPPAAPVAPVRPVAPPPLSTPATPQEGIQTRRPIRVQPIVRGARLNGAVLTVPLTDLSEGWPEAVRQEIALANLSGAVAALPMDFVEAGLKLGRVRCSWKQLRAWLQPAQPLQPVSAQDGTILELPLKVVAPLFLAKQKSAPAPRKASIDADIPDLFFNSAISTAPTAPPATPARVPTAVPTAPVGEPAPEPVTPPALPQPQTKPADTNYYVWRDNQDTPIEPEVIFKKGPSAPGTDFLKRYATPNEIVSRAAALDGVAGALISLPDGLLVASRIPPEINADTLAAFLPQIFGRVAQTTKELRMGELNNLNFTVGNVPWKIFKVGSIFFAAFGRTGEPLPTAQLAGLAAELDRKPR
jgi:predicted regulator of Ras-like GTPase activity (Roadblock/LC7/MglB family)